jgi:hypothetical protein
MLQQWHSLVVAVVQDSQASNAGPISNANRSTDMCFGSHATLSFDEIRERRGQVSALLNYPV